MFQALGIGAIGSMLRRSNEVEETSGVTNDDAASAITQGESSDYNPKEDEDIDGEEIDDCVVEKPVKVCKILSCLGDYGVLCLLCHFLSCFFTSCCAHSIFLHVF